ncbi:MAG: serine acetyltransferase [Desulfobulbaceae bacterium]|nr:serine acetyltransferase [Desulfobulbaceae bacterium]
MKNPNHNNTICATWKILCDDFLAMTFGTQQPSIKKIIYSYLFRPGFRAVFLLRLSMLFQNKSKTISNLITMHCFRSCGIEFTGELQCGSGLVFRHPVGTVINSNSIIGDNCSIGGSVTIGQKIPIFYSPDAPIIGDNVTIGNGSTILGSVRIGNNVIIGANSLIIHDIDNNSVVAGNPPRLICTYDDYVTKMGRSRTCG